MNKPQYNLLSSPQTRENLNSLIPFLNKTKAVYYDVKCNKLDNWELIFQLKLL